MYVEISSKNKVVLGCGDMSEEGCKLVDKNFERLRVWGRRGKVVDVENK